MDRPSPHSRGGRFADAERRGCDRLRPEGFSPIVLIADRRRLECRIANLSLTGLMLSFVGEPPELGEATLEHPAAGRIAGRAVWREAGRLGIRLAEPKSELQRALQCLNLIGPAG